MSNICDKYGYATPTLEQIKEGLAKVMAAPDALPGDVDAIKVISRIFRDYPLQGVVTHETSTTLAHQAMDHRLPDAVIVGCGLFACVLFAMSSGFDRETIRTALDKVFQDVDESLETINAELDSGALDLPQATDNRSVEERADLLKQLAPIGSRQVYHGKRRDKAGTEEAYDAPFTVEEHIIDDNGPSVFTTDLAVPGMPQLSGMPAVIPLSYWETGRVTAEASA